MMSRVATDVDPTSFGTTRYVQDGDVAVLHIDNPPSNALSFQIRSQMLNGLQRACEDASVGAVVVVGSERAFCSGADIRQFDTPSYYAHPRTRHLAQAIEAAAKPVVAAIAGFALGGGLELALAAHARVAIAGAELGLPEVKLGVIPAAGGLLRLPRLVGVSRAYELVMKGMTFTAEQAQGWGIIDVVCANALVEHAKEYARSLIGHPIRRTLSLPLKNDTIPPSEHHRDPARAAIHRCLAALLSEPTDAVDQLVQRYSAELVASARAKALRYVFMAQRKVARVAASAAPFPAEAIVVDGADTGLAARLARAGVRLRRAPVVTREASLMQKISVTTSAPDTIVEVGVAQPDGDHGVFEIVQTPSTPPEVAKALVGVAKRMSLVPVVISREPVAPRLERAMQIALGELIAKGVESDAIRAALIEAGFTGETIAHHLQLFAADENHCAVPPGEVRTEDIAGHCIAALAREGARLVEEKVAVDPAAVDVVAVFGLGFPADRGGPMYAVRAQALSAAQAVS